MDKKNLYTLADRLQFLINERGYSHNDVARLCGIKQGSVSYILAKNLRKSKLANEMADGLNVSYEWLTKGEGPMTIEKAYAIPLFKNVFDAVKFYKNDFSGEVPAYTYSNKKTLASQTLAIEFAEQYTCICAFHSALQDEVSCYLDLSDILNNKVALQATRENPNDFPVVELRLQHPPASQKTLLNSLNKLLRG